MHQAVQAVRLLPVGGERPVPGHPEAPRMGDHLDRSEARGEHEMPVTMDRRRADRIEEEARPVLEAPAVASGTVIRREQLAEQVFVTALDVRAVEARVLRHLRRRAELLREAVEVFVRHDGPVGGDVHLLVHHGIVI